MKPLLKKKFTLYFLSCSQRETEKESAAGRGINWSNYGKCSTDSRVMAGVDEYQVRGGDEENTEY